MKKLLIASGVAALAFASVVGAQGYQFSSNLTVGSTGADVVALQTWLIANGYSIPAIASGAASKGYFGSQTKSAVMAYQASRGIPNTGFVGPLTRGALNGGAVATAPSFSCPVGYTCTAKVGSTVTGTEGTISATQSNSGLASSVYENDTMVSILGVKLEAKTSDIVVQRVKLDLGTDTKIYNKIYKKIYITDGSTVYGSADLNSSTVVKDSTRYYITISGLNLIVPRNASKNLIVKADVYPTIDSADIDVETYTVRLASNGIRGVDGVGIDQYTGDTSITKTYSISTSLSESATLKVSLNTSTVKAADVVATAGSNENERDNVTLMTFDLKAEKDAVKITDLNIGVAKSGTGGATASTTVHLYDGSTELDSVSITGNTAVFTDLDYVIPKDTTKTLTVKVDVRSANGTSARFVATASSSGVTAENTQGDSVTVSGSATGNSIGVRNVGPVFTLLAAPTAERTVVESGNIATSTMKGSYIVKVEAVGGDITFGSNASGTPMFAVANFYTLKGGASTVLNVASTTAFSVPSTGVVTSGIGSNSFKLQEGNSVIIPVDYQFEGRTVAGAQVGTDSYSIGISAINWDTDSATGQTSTFMSGELDWSTPTKTLP